MDKLFLFRSLIVVLMICLLVWDGLPMLTHAKDTLPEQHKEILLTSALLWIATIFINQNSNDDDWARRF